MALVITTEDSEYNGLCYNVNIQLKQVVALMLYAEKEQHKSIMRT